MPMILESPPVREITPKQKISMSLKFQGKEYKEIAKEIGVSVDTLRHWYMHSGPLGIEYKRFCERVMAPKPITTVNDAVTVADRIKELASPAIEEVARVMHHAKYDDTRLSAAKDILDRAGYMPVQKMLNVHAVEEMSIDQLDSFIAGVLTHETKRIPSHTPVYKEAVSSIDVPDLTDIPVNDNVPDPCVPGTDVPTSVGIDDAGGVVR